MNRRGKWKGNDKKMKNEKKVKRGNGIEKKNEKGNYKEMKRVIKNKEKTEKGNANEKKENMVCQQK